MPNPFVAVGAVIVGVALMQLAGGLFGVLTPLNLAAAGHSATAIGLVATVYSLGFLLGCLIAAPTIRAVGHIRAFAAFAAALAATSLVFALAVDPLLWGALRLVAGLCAAVLFTVAESWLNDRTPRESRGRVMSTYMLGTKGALVAASALLTLESVGPVAFFMLASACYSLALIPIATTRSAHPKPPDVVTLGLGRLYRTAPAAMVGCLTAGLVNSAILGVAPAWSVLIGLGREDASLLIAASHVGSLALQWPIGWLSDRIDRRVVIAATSGAAALVALAVAALGTAAPNDVVVAALIVAFALWGGAALSIYSLCVAHANDFADQSQMVALSSSLLLTWAAGSIVGPTAATLAMEAVGPAGLFLYGAAVNLGLVGFALWRRTRRAALPPEVREAFVNLPATSPALVPLDPRAPENAADGREEEEGWAEARRRDYVGDWAI